MNTVKMGLFLATAADYYNKNGWGSEYAANGLHNMKNFINYQSWIVNIFTSIKWWLIELIYGLANAASEVLNKMLNVTSFLTTGMDSKSQLGQFIYYARIASFALLAVALVIMGISLFVSRRPPEIKNILIQAVTAVILILEVGPATNWLVQQSTNLYNGVVQTSGKKGTSSLPFEILKGSTNDLEYLISNNFTPTPASSNQSKIKGAGNYTKPITPPTAKFGYNDLTKSEVDHGDVYFDQIITWNEVDSNMPLWNKDKEMGHNDSHKGKFFLFAWLMHQPQTMKDSKDKKIYLAPDIQRIGGTGDSLTKFSFGGYPRFSVDTVPTIIALAALAVAFLFAGFAIVKAIIELALMQILSVFLFSTDNSEGSRTKRVVTTMFSLSILIGLQGIELAFYKIVMLWGIEAKNKGTFGTGLVCDLCFVLIAVVATVLLIGGSQHVSMFFGVDTGAQHGLRSAVMTGAAATSLAKNVTHGASSLRSRAEKEYENHHNKDTKEDPNNPNNLNKNSKPNDEPQDRPTVNEKESSWKNEEYENPSPSVDRGMSKNKKDRDKMSENTPRPDNMSNRVERNVSHSVGEGADSNPSKPGSNASAKEPTSPEGKTPTNLDLKHNNKTNHLNKDNGYTDIDSPQTKALRRQLSKDVDKQQQMYLKPENYSPSQVQKQDDIVRNDRRDLKKSELTDRTKQKQVQPVQRRKTSSLKNPGDTNEQRKKGSVKLYRPEDDPRRPKR